MKTKNNKGFIHLVLIMIIVGVLMVVGIVFLKGVKKVAKMDYEVGTTQNQDKTTSEPVGLEEELNSLELSDPSKDFSEVDSDISAL